MTSKFEPAAWARAISKTCFSLADTFIFPVTGPRVLVYHQIGAGHGYQLDLPPEVFRRHLEFLRQHGEIVRFEEALARAHEPAADRMFVLSFDDGYADMFVNAFPMLLRHEVPFTLYLSTGPIEAGKPFSPQRFSDPVTWHQVNQMLESGLVTLGSHTHSHADLRGLSLEQVFLELDQCDEIIQRRTGLTPRHFAYPWGYWSEVAASEVSRRYSSAVVGGSFRRDSVGDRHAFPRIPIQLSDGVLFFRRKCRRGLRTEERARRIVTGYKGP